METLYALYNSHPFWIWLAVGVLLLAIEAMTSTEWLLWPAVAAGVVAVLTAALVALGWQVGLPWEVAIFAVLTVVMTVLSRSVVRRANPAGPDINDRDQRLIGQSARVIEPFINGRGRVFISGAEWVAELAPGQAGPEETGLYHSVTVEAVRGTVLHVRAI